MSEFSVRKFLSKEVNSTIQSIVYASIPTVVLALSMSGLATAAPPSGRVAIMNAHSGLCLSPAGGGRDKNGQIVQFTCDQDPSRFWSFTVVNGNTVEITNVNSGLCLTIAGGNTERNIVSVQYNCDSDPSRRWRYTVVDATRFRLVNAHSGLCLTIAGGGTDKNTTAVQYPCDGDPSRDWLIRSGR
jgi:cytolethal distending toxin subunit A